jgi:hypothetical protein
MTMDTPSMADITDSEWEALASRRIFFGHQSVGRDLMLGLKRVLQDHPEIGLAVVSSDQPGQVEGPAFIEANIGKNLEPETKADAFAEILEDGFGSEPGAVAMYKYCYVDIQPAPDPDLLFEDYVDRTEALRGLYPPEWTYDGGHLNDEAKYRMAERLLVFLARLPGSGDGVRVADAGIAAHR